MKTHDRIWNFLLAVILIGCFAAVCGAQATAPGAIELVARVTPGGGRPEPVRDISFYALRESVAEIRREAEQTIPPLSLDGFIDGLERSPELKAWMKEHRTVKFAGTDFIKQLKPDDIIHVPEFLDAYKTLNASALREAAPEPRIKPGEAQKNPEKVARAHEQYQQALRHFISTNPESIQGLDAELLDKNPGPAWDRAQADQQRKVARRILELAQSKYTCASASTDLAGRASMPGLAPGDYWLTSLDTPALAGDTRIEWDMPVTVRAGETSRVELNNLNAVDTTERAGP